MEIELSTPISSCSKQESLSRLGKCEVCNFHDAKYTCPKCEVKTCSLKCNKIHKLEIECDGNRDKTKFVPLHKFTDMDFESDYKLLEGISEGLDSIKKKSGFQRNSNTIPVRLIKLRNIASQRKTTLKFLPYKFERHRKNTTQVVDFKTNTIAWHIEWVFVNADNLHLSTAKVPETEKLGSVLSQFLVKQEDPVMQEKLQYYQAVNISGLKLLLKAEQKSGKKFFELDYTLSIKENLVNRIIIEYPTIHVVLKEHAAGYNIIDSDDESEMNAKPKLGSQVVNQLLVKAENDDDLFMSLKNLLFISEYSDEEKSE